MARFTAEGFLLVHFSRSLYFMSITFNFIHEQFSFLTRKLLFCIINVRVAFRGSTCCLPLISTPIIELYIFHVSSFRCKNPLFGATQYFWLSSGQENSLSRVSVAADYSDQLPDSSSFVGNNGYHPLEEIREQRRLCAKLTDAEIARTTVEVFIYFIININDSIHLTSYHLRRGKLFLSAIRMGRRSDFSF